ncbi:DinB family protein [Falsibacillus albus]|uniref:Damage-inducible protein DinB n=1 Tax=Falsibacillus albus TaxID=2478915 RepID=A0A3L7JZW1_9BACI|nr:DinB family protein [Falsibacillus albus]RLQ96070.1 hypothetical protein D9X91_07185 [Falsibacillus albus]
MFQTIDGFLLSWKYESELTMKILNALTDLSLDQPVSKDDRSLGSIAWHLVTSPLVLLGHTGLIFQAPNDQDPVPDRADEIVSAYNEMNESFMNAIQSQWEDSDLTAMSNMFGRELPNHFFLMTLIRHQIHHRGQMTVLMRQADLKVPGIYGPAREEWAALGLEKPKL